MRSVPLVLLVCVCIALCGCGKKAIDIVGKWKLDTPVPMPGATSTDVTFAADHTFTGVYSGTWSMSGDTVTLKINTMAGISMDTFKSMTASQPNGAAAAKLFDSMPLKVDSDGKNMSMTDGKGSVSPMPMFTKQ